MKNTIKFLAILLVIFTFNSCDDSTELADIEFNTSISEILDVHIDQGQTALDQNFDFDIDNDDTNAYLDNINDVTITSFTYKITNFTGNSDCFIDITLASGDTIIETRAIAVQSASENATVFTVTNTSALNEISNAFLETREASLNFSGDVSNGVADFNIELDIDLNVVANPLD